MKYWQAFLFYLAAFLLQPFLYGIIPSAGINLNMILCLTVVFTFVYDEVLPGLFFGPIFGLLTDVMYGQYIGPAAFAIAIAGVIVFVLKEYFNNENVINAILMLIASTWIFVTVIWVIYNLSDNSYGYLYALRVLPAQLILNTVVGTLLYLVLIKKAVKHRKDRYFR